MAGELMLQSDGRMILGTGGLARLENPNADPCCDPGLTVQALYSGGSGRYTQNSANILVSGTYLGTDRTGGQGFDNASASDFALASGALAVSFSQQTPDGRGILTATGTLTQLSPDTFDTVSITPPAGDVFATVQVSLTRSNVLPPSNETQAVNRLRNAATSVTVSVSANLAWVRDSGQTINLQESGTYTSGAELTYRQNNEWWTINEPDGLAITSQGNFPVTWFVAQGRMRLSLLG